VSKNALQGIGNFLGTYAGEHVAGTGFVIGMLFVAHGVSVTDRFLGGLIGNLLAVGVCPGIGMFLGHDVAWISSGLYAATSEAPGEVAYQAIGTEGALCVIVAGCTTANSTLSGL
jgi:hypothetical protein